MKSYAILAAVLALVAAKRPYDKPGIDHILLGAANLDDGMRAFEKATGVAPLRGGRHPSRGTENALVSLGHGAYLEIIAPQSEAQPNQMVSSLRGLRAPALIGWAVHVVDAADAAARLDRAGFITSQPQPGSRVRPQGDTLEWVTFEVTSPRVDGAPFFIRWGDKTTHPSLTSPGGCTIKSFQVAHSRNGDLSRLLDALGIALDSPLGERPAMHLTLRCGAREATFASP